MDNRTIYILSPCHQPLPIGVTGEIYIGGAGVGRGYLRRPELTRERFIPDPFSTDCEARLYKTGDLGRWRTDGRIEFLGRNDHQVKIRGYRIELGEIEAQIASHEDVQDVVVAVREDKPGRKLLVAYVVSRSAKPNIQELTDGLRNHAKNLLPAHMLPSAWVILEQMPLTPNGKVDRKTLAGPLHRPKETREFIAPRDDVERMLSDIWTQVLGVKHIGVQDNFFELGGHSLFAGIVVSHIRERAHVELPLRALFDAQTLEQLAGVIRSELHTRPTATAHA